MYAVAGVSGQTGAAVARALLEAGETVRVIVRRPEAGADWKAQGAEVAVADLRGRRRAQTRASPGSWAGCCATSAGGRRRCTARGGCPSGRGGRCT